MPLAFEPLHPLFGATVSGLDMRKTVDEATLAAFLNAMDEYAVCAVPHNTPPTDPQHIAFCGRLGPMERNTQRIKGTDKRVVAKEIVDQSNLGPDGEIYSEGDRRLAFKRANRLWHTDMSFYVNRATWSALAAHAVPPEGGNTEFADMRAAYDDLSEAMKKRLAGLTAEHCYWYSRVLGGAPEPTDEERASRPPPAKHALVHDHPRSGRKVLYIASHIRGITGMPDDEAKDLLAELNAHATQEQYVLSYQWSVGDVVVWDNLATMHRATPFPDQQYVRDMRRVTCREEVMD